MQQLTLTLVGEGSHKQEKKGKYGAFTVAPVIKNPPAKAGSVGSSHDLGKMPMPQSK